MRGTLRDIPTIWGLFSSQTLGTGKTASDDRDTRTTLLLALRIHFTFVGTLCFVGPGEGEAENQQTLTQQRIGQGNNTRGSNG